MAEDALLSELCAICHVNRPKYKCPRCSIQTCSLSCVKRHKLWSQCSGARDAAAYKKRHQLATPSSLDQDFNFITRVERTLERAGAETQERGLALGEDGRKRVKGEARRDAETQQRRAIVLKAPPGMSRALQNKSKWDNRHKCLLWTVEWILDNGSKVLGNCQETRTVSEAFANAVGKRKWQSLPSCASKSMSITQDHEAKSTAKTPSNSLSDSATQVKSTAVVDHHFYLHRPNLPSNIRCIIPLEPDVTIRDAVCGTVLIEFPSIFVLGVSKDRLEKPFITEEEYMKQHGNGVLKSVAEATDAPSTADDNHEDSIDLRVLPQLTEERIEEALQNDLGKF